MDFRQQYKNEMQHIVPSEEQSEKIRARVYEEIQKPLKAPKRKLPLKAITITGASAACLVLAATFALNFTLEKEALDNAAGGGTLNRIYHSADNYTAPSAKPAAECNEGNAGGGMDATADYTPSAPGKSLQTESIAFGMRIELNDKLSECTVYNGDEVKTYARSNEAEPASEDEKLLTQIPKDRNSLGEDLFVRIDGKKIRIYGQYKDFLGTYIETT